MKILGRLALLQSAKGNNRIGRTLAAASVAGVFVMVALNVQTTGQQQPQNQPPAAHSVWDGIYTDKQAQRGEALYREKCSSCHGEKLVGKEGDDDTPALTGKDFSTAWTGQMVGDLYRKILRKMPQDTPGTLTPQQTVDLVSFILRFNKFPVGKTELAAETESLDHIRFDARKPE